LTDEIEIKKREKKAKRTGGGKKKKAAAAKATKAESRVETPVEEMAAGTEKSES
jgi:hypothetical protein